MDHYSVTQLLLSIATKKFTALEKYSPGTRGKILERQFHGAGSQSIKGYGPMMILAT